MRNIFVPQVGQLPWVAGLPFFILIDLALLISLFFRHFMQYACILVTSFVFEKIISNFKYVVNRKMRVFTCIFKKFVFVVL